MSVYARAVGIAVQLTIAWIARPSAQSLLFVMLRVVNVVDGGSEGAKSCTKLAAVTKHSHPRGRSRESVYALSMVTTLENFEERDDIAKKALDDRGE